MRLDKYLFDNGYYPSREKAKMAIEKGYILVDGVKILKPAFEVLNDVKIEIEEDLMKYVSMGGYKLEEAITKFNLDFKDKVVLDIGSSTGGFTDCSLKHQAKTVVSVDVGTSQLHPSLESDKRVIVYENTNILDFNSALEFDYLVMDLSFVSIKKIIPSLTKFFCDNTKMVLLIKPQFEVGAIKIKGGVLKDQKAHLEVLDDVLGFIKKLDFKINGLTYSPNRGKKGNIEYLALLSFRGNDNYNIKDVVNRAFNNL